MTEDARPQFSTSQTSIKSKRHSLNIISPGPRPLHLASGSVLSSPSRSPSRSPALHHCNSNSPSPTPSLFGASSVKNGRRQSSISYLPTNKDKDKDRPMSLVSPLSPTGFSRGIDLSNGNPSAAGSPGVELEMEEGPKVTMGIGATSPVTLDVLKQLKGRPPVTLAEKHADLLHFIAQKESKCLDLRSQLATHEAELLQLKRKWERIVNRRFEKNPSNSFPLPSNPSTASPSYSYSSSNTTSAAASSGSGVVLEGIKEGVQGVSRFITAGLESIAHVGIAEGNTSIPSSTGALSPTSSGNRRQSLKFPIPLRLTSGNNHGHASQSSSSTSASITTAASSSSTSATSLILESGIIQPLSPPFTSTFDETSNEYDEFGDFEEAPTRNLNELSEQEENVEQVLMVHDTGATPTMSPNPHFQRRSRTEAEQKSPTSDIFGSGFDSGWDGWTTSGALTTVVGSSLPNPGSPTQTLSSSSTTRTVRPVPTKPPNRTTNLPGVSSIPGLASSSMSMNGATPQLMSTWVGSMGKKWGEIRESQTFTKSQKRASILLSDVSQSIVSALISPSHLSASSRPSKSPLENPFATNASHPPSPSHSTNAEASITTNKNEMPSSTSLLDDLDIEKVDEALGLGIGSPMLVPDQASKNDLNPSVKPQVKAGMDISTLPGVSSSNFLDDEEWNW